VILRARMRANADAAWGEIFVPTKRTASLSGTISSLDALGGRKPNEPARVKVRAPVAALNVWVQLALEVGGEVGGGGVVEPPPPPQA